MEEAWYQAWADLPQEQIQQWISAIPDHIQEIIRLEGGNDYKEGVRGFKRSWIGRRIKGLLSTHKFVNSRAQHQASSSEDGDGEVNSDMEEEIWNVERISSN
jgi:hypothetical protein